MVLAAFIIDAVASFRGARRPRVRAWSELRRKTAAMRGILMYLFEVEYRA